MMPPSPPIKCSGSKARLKLSTGAFCLLAQSGKVQLSSKLRQTEFFHAKRREREREGKREREREREREAPQIGRKEIPLVALFCLFIVHDYIHMLAKEAKTVSIYMNFA
jgi:hypothetical protein